MSQPLASDGKYSLVLHTHNHLRTRGFPRFSQGGFRPTEAGVKVYDPIRKEERQIGKCSRATYFRLKGLDVEIQYSAKEQIRNEVGKQVELTLVNYWKEMGIYIDSEVKFFGDIDGIPISGELDCVLEEPETGLRYIAEEKTIYGYYAAKEIFGNKTTLPKPKVSHALQALIYLYYFKYFAKSSARLNYALLFYVERGDGEHSHFYLDIEEEVQVLDGQEYIVHRPSYTYFTNHHAPTKVKYPFTMEQVIENYRYVQGFLEGEIPPDREYEYSYSPEIIETLYKAGEIAETKYQEWKRAKKKKPLIGAWPCSYCPYLDICYDRNTYEPKEFDVTLIKKRKLVVLPEKITDILI